MDWPVVQDCWGSKKEPVNDQRGIKSNRRLGNTRRGKQGGDVPSSPPRRKTCWIDPAQKTSARGKKGTTLCHRKGEEKKGTHKRAPRIDEAQRKGSIHPKKMMSKRAPKQRSDGPAHGGKWAKNEKTKTEVHNQTFQAREKDLDS